MSLSIFVWYTFCCTHSPALFVCSSKFCCAFWRFLIFLWTVCKYVLVLHKIEIGMTISIIISMLNEKCRRSTLAQRYYTIIYLRVMWLDSFCGCCYCGCCFCLFVFRLDWMWRFWDDVLILFSICAGTFYTIAVHRIWYLSLHYHRLLRKDFSHSETQMLLLHA